MGVGQRFGRMAAGLALCGVVVLSCAKQPAPSIAPRLAEPLTAPRGYIAFCTREPQFCDGHGPRSVRLTGARWAELLQVNDEVNGRLKPAPDQAPVGMADDWEIPTGAAAADCEDYVLAKKLQLLALGWPGPALRIAVVEVPGRRSERRRHAVLLADTDKGIFVLDNLSRLVTGWSATQYRWIEVQVSTDPDSWQRVRPGG